MRTMLRLNRIIVGSFMVREEIINVTHYYNMGFVF